MDLFVHDSSIAGSGFGSLEEGRRVSYEPTRGRKGEQAEKVRRLRPRLRALRQQRAHRAPSSLRRLPVPGRDPHPQAAARPVERRTGREPETFPSEE